MNLDPILNYSMSEIEARAYKLCLLWEKIMDKELPDYHKNRITNRKGDPRGALIFKYCYKLANETKGLIADEDYKLYILAQVQMLKSYSDGTVHALIEPPCLVGDKAWMRWQIWKSKFDKVQKGSDYHNETDDVSENIVQIVVDLKNTKEFLDKNCKNIEESIKNRDIVKWASFGRVSPYYLILSPLVARYMPNLEDTFSYDIEIYKKSITENVKREFNKIFGE